MGHSAGGVITQILLDHGYGACGVAINSAPTEGVKGCRCPRCEPTFPVLKNPANRHRPSGSHFEQWQLRVHQHVQRRRVAPAVRALPRPGLRADLLGERPGQPPSPATTTSGSTTTTTPARRCCSSPATEDHIMPPSVQRSNAKHYKSKTTVTELEEFDGSATCSPLGRAGKRWLTSPSTGPNGTRCPGLTHDRPGADPHRRADHAHRVRRVAPAHRSDLRSPRTQVRLRLGDVVDQAQRPGVPTSRSRPGRRGASDPRPPRRQPRRPRSPAPRLGAGRGDQRHGSGKARRECPWAARLAGDAPRSAGATDHRRDGHAVPSRSAAHQADRRRRRRVRVDVRGAPGTAPFGCQATRSSTTASARSPIGSMSTSPSSTWAACGSR